MPIPLFEISAILVPFSPLQTHSPVLQISDKPYHNHCLLLKMGYKQELSLTLSPDLYMEKGIRARH